MAPTEWKVKDFSINADDARVRNYELQDGIEGTKPDAESHPETWSACDIRRRILV